MQILILLLNKREVDFESFKNRFAIFFYKIFDCIEAVPWNALSIAHHHCGNNPLYGQLASVIRRIRNPANVIAADRTVKMIQRSILLDHAWFMRVYVVDRSRISDVQRQLVAFRPIAQIVTVAYPAPRVFAVKHEIIHNV